MEAHNVRTLDDLTAYIEEHADTIYVREQVDGRWGAYSLAELPSKLAIKHVLRFVRESFVPARMLTPCPDQNDIVDER